MRVLVAYEMSGRVSSAFRSKGHDAWSCDLLPTLGDPLYHIQGDVNALLDLDPSWDLLIAHPPCTSLCVSGNRHYAGSQARQEALLEVKHILSLDIPRICLENPVGVISSRIRPPDQYIQPWQFGHPESKKTGLWLKNLPPLLPTKTLSKPSCGFWENQTPSGQNKIGPSSTRSVTRSLTYFGIAEAMADQWG